jgi:hypothetical protein
MVEQLTARPVRFGQANPGMQDKGVDFDANIEVESDFWRAEGSPEHIWSEAREHAVEFAKGMYEAGYHKQVYNRLVEPFQMMKTVVSGTEFGNFFWLRDDDAADPTIAELSRCMKLAMAGSVPLELEDGEWHLPYVKAVRNLTGTLNYFIEAEKEGFWIPLDEREAIHVSSARSAAVSFRNTDYGLEKSEEVYARLVGDKRKHASALEHQATPMMPTTFGDSDDQDDWNIPTMPHTWERGISHMDRQGRLWSGNLHGWIQHRKLIPGENME